MREIYREEAMQVAGADLSPGSAGALFGTGLTTIGGALVGVGMTGTAGMAVGAVGLVAAGPVLVAAAGGVMVGYGLYEFFN
jgi:hypothetical protein